MDERAIDIHLNHCQNVFEESQGCENQHPYITLQREAERQTTGAMPPAMVKTNNSSNRMSMDPSKNSTQRMSVQAVNPAKEEPYNPQCYTCGRTGHIARWCRTGTPRDRGTDGPRGRGQGANRGQEHERRPPPPQRQQRPREEDRPRQVQQVATAPKQPAFHWNTQRVATCNMPGSMVSSGINNIVNNVLPTLKLAQVNKGDRQGCAALIPTAGVPNWTDDNQVQEEYEGGRHQPPKMAFHALSLAFHALSLAILGLAMPSMALPLTSPALNNK